MAGLSVTSLFHLPVFTQSGQHIGTVSDIEYAEEDLRIERFIVKPKGFGALFQKDLLIHRDQVVSLTREKMIVFDGTIKDLRTAVSSDMA